MLVHQRVVGWIENWMILKLDVSQSSNGFLLRMFQTDSKIFFMGNPWRKATKKDGKEIDGVHWFPIEKISLEPIHWWRTPWFCGPKPHFGVSDNGEIHPQKEGGVPVMFRLQPILTSHIRYCGWLVVWNIFSHIIGNNHPNWLSYFSEG